MRIEAYNQVAGLYKPTTTGSVQNVNPVGMGKDNVQISSVGLDYQIAKQAVAAAPAVREDKIAQVKAMVDAGVYQVEPGDFAAKLLEKYNQTAW